MASKKFYATFEHKISERVIERAYENTPDANADGTIDYYREHMGCWDALCGFKVDSFAEAESYVMNQYQTTINEDEWHIIIRSTRM